MFDRKLIEGFATDLDLNEVLASACKGAADLMANARERTRYTHFTPQPDGRRYSIIENPEANTVRLMARAIMTPYRAAFEARTEMERYQSEAMARIGAVAFLEPACSGETCLDCDRPLWHHIRKWGAVTMCPFGREFWSLARALLREGGTLRHGEGFERLQTIATPR